MAQKISSSKGFTSTTFDTYVPELSDNADIQNAFELFYYGNSEDGNATGDVSLYANLVDFDSRITSATSGLSGHAGGVSDVHGVGVGHSVVGTGTTQTLTNKTLTTPKINENINLTATSTELNVLDGITASTAELNIMDGVTASTAEINYVDGVTSNIQTQLNTNTPAGMISIHAGATAPTGWLLCDGTSYASASYTTLFNVIGYTFGGSGANFNVPNLKGKVVVGIDAAQTEFDTRGETGGSMNHQHTVASSGAITSTNHDGHGHSVNGHNHANSATASSSSNSSTSIDGGSHNHGDNFAASTGVATTTGLAPTSGTPGGQTARNHTHAVTVSGSVSNDASHAHGASTSTTTNTNVTITNNSAGASANTDGSHSHTTTIPQHTSDSLSNLQPYMALNYIIKF